MEAIKKNMALFFSVVEVAAIMLLIMWSGQASPQSETEDSCVSCHLELGGAFATPVEQMRDGSHADARISCAGCHGGDPTSDDIEVAMSPTSGFVGVPSREETPQFCGRCHSDPEYIRQFNPRLPTDQLSQYRTSVHGQRLEGGDARVATCTDCHGAHGILSARDARSPVYSMNIPATCATCHADQKYMESYEISTDQVQDYRESVHGRALLDRGDQAAPACNDCHGNHGASPPGVPAVGFVCGQCHANNRELFRESPHQEMFSLMGLPECEACHGNHRIEHPTDAMISATEENVCLDCHAEESDAYLRSLAMYEEITNLKDRIASAEQLVNRAEQAGMLITDAQFQLQDADDYLIQAHTMVHSLSADRVKEVTDQGQELANLAIRQGNEALDELQFRRKGLAVSLVFILILASGIYLKIREIDNRNQQDEIS